MSSTKQNGDFLVNVSNDFDKIPISNVDHLPK
jgi:hypothetical protein